VIDAERPHRVCRAIYDRQRIYSILDEAFMCHVGYVIERQPFVIPMIYGRSGDRIFLHGSALSRTVCSLADGIDACVTVTLVDGLVLARSAFRHSINYRSVVILGKARPVTDRVEKFEALQCLTNHVAAGRWEEVRQPDETEMMSTGVLAMPLNEVSAKSRSGFPIDLQRDYSFPVWAGVIPVRMELGEPVADTHVPADVPVLDKNRFTR
jgi:nitroimidazol reductase NimA-like FMN-containing flavoprotein (pyridoxamine 5'-phosphate oxidase superfamily)